MPKKIVIPEKISNYQKSQPKKFWFIILVISILLLAVIRKDLFVAALVNGQPISNLELQTRLNQQFKTQTLTQMVNEKLLQQEAAKKGIVIAQSDLDTKVKEVENQYGGADAFNSILSQQGMNMVDFLAQIKLQLTVEKLYSSEASPSGADIDKFMSDNKDLPEATEPAKFRETVTKQVSQQNLAKVFNEKFQALKQAAKIQIF